MDCIETTNNHTPNKKKIRLIRLKLRKKMCKIIPALQKNLKIINWLFIYFTSNKFKNLIFCTKSHVIAVVKTKLDEVTYKILLYSK